MVRAIPDSSGLLKQDNAGICLVLKLPRPHSDQASIELGLGLKSVDLTPVGCEVRPPWTGFSTAHPMDAKSYWDLGSFGIRLTTPWALRHFSSTHSWMIFLVWFCCQQVMPKHWGGALDGCYASKNIHMNARTHAFRAEHCIVERWSLIFSSPAIGFNVLVDRCIHWEKHKFIANEHCCLTLYDVC